MADARSELETVIWNPCVEVAELLRLKPGSGAFCVHPVHSGGHFRSLATLFSLPRASKLDISRREWKNQRNDGPRDKRPDQRHVVIDATLLIDDRNRFDPGAGRGRKGTKDDRKPLEKRCPVGVSGSCANRAFIAECLSKSQGCVQLSTPRRGFENFW